jgi:phage terminase Nu1 subunit (DNA packaging protein)
MGQAKRRGTKDQRVAEALQAEQARIEAKAEKERLEEEAKAERWRQLTPEQKAQALKNAKDDAALFSILMGAFSPSRRRGELTRRTRIIE